MDDPLGVPKLEAAGFTNIANIEGGTSAWHAAGLYVEGKKDVSGKTGTDSGSLVVTVPRLGNLLSGGFGHPLLSVWDWSLLE